VETYQTEEEQVEALKKWWQENSRSTILAIVVALGAGFGWQGWQEHQLEQAETASLDYEAMLEAVSTASAPGATQDQKTTARHLATGLKSDFASSTYAQFAGLHLARMEVEENNLAAAEEELRWVLAQSPAPEIQLVAQLRLARIEAAQGDTEAALKLVSVEDTGAFAASYAEAEGDFQLAMGDTMAARAAYERALALQLGQSGSNGALQMKLKQLTPVPARELNPSAMTVEAVNIVESAEDAAESSIEPVADPAAEGDQ